MGEAHSQLPNGGLLLFFEPIGIINARELGTGFRVPTNWCQLILNEDSLPKRLQNQPEDYKMLWLLRDSFLEKERINGVWDVSNIWYLQKWTKSEVLLQWKLLPFQYRPFYVISCNIEWGLWGGTSAMDKEIPHCAVKLCTDMNRNLFPAFFGSSYHELLNLRRIYFRKIVSYWITIRI